MTGMTTPRSQQTISHPVEISGVGFFTGVDVTLKMLPAPAHTGIVFQRTDRAHGPLIPALIENVQPTPRRTVIGAWGTSVQLVEHVMAALYGLQVDNCLLQLNGPEVPGCDGSSQPFVELIEQAGVTPQEAYRKTLVIDRPGKVGDENSSIEFRPATDYTISYAVDYGEKSPVPQTTSQQDVTRAAFLQDICPARTFVLETEVEYLRSQGIGTRISAKDVLVFGDKGPIQNKLRMSDECSRHKLLDCIGDFALIGCDLVGHFTAHRSGHQMNHELIRQLRKTYLSEFPQNRAA